MNRRERRYGRMFSLPLLLALTGLALLPLEWGLRLVGFDAFRELAQTMLHSCASVVYPLVLLFLYLFRVPPTTARIFSFVSLGLFLAQMGAVLACAKQTPPGLLDWVPGHELLFHISALQLEGSMQNILLTCADAAFVLSTLSASVSCPIYAAMKTRADTRNAELDRRNETLMRRTTKTKLDQLKSAPTDGQPLPPD